MSHLTSLLGNQSNKSYYLLADKGQELKFPRFNGHSERGCDTPKGMFNGDAHTGNDSGPRLYFANLVYTGSIGTSFAQDIYATNFFCKEIEIKKTALVLVTALAVFIAGTAQADTLELADGRLIEGDFIGSSNGIIMFDTGGGIEAFPEDKVVGLFLSAGIATKEAMSADSVTVPI